jgi:hypothetical protein
VAQFYRPFSDEHAILFVAAPDLLDALRSVLIRYEHAMKLIGQTDSGFSESSEVVAARAAIAKAERGQS